MRVIQWLQVCIILTFLLVRPGLKTPPSTPSLPREPLSLGTHFKPPPSQATVSPFYINIVRNLPASLFFHISLLHRHWLYILCVIDVSIESL